MKRFVGIAIVAAAAATVLPAAVIHAQSKDEKIAQAVLPLPEDLKAAATVVDYDEKTGDRSVLRQGTNFIECQPKAKDGFVRCYNKVMAPRHDMEAKLRAQRRNP